MENIISHYHSLLCKRNNQYPYITKHTVVVRDSCVDFIYQFVKDSNSRAKEYNSENARSIEDTCSNIIGPPTEFPNYGDFSKTLVVKNNRSNISISPWQKEPYLPFVSLHCRYCHKLHDENTIRLNYIDLEFHKAVYPIRVSIYEVYNPGIKSDIDKSDHKSKFVMHKQVHHSNYAYFIKDIELYWNESNEQPRSSFSGLPDEIILKILKDLDIRSLCSMSRVNKRLNNLTWDPFLLTSLNLRYMYSDNVIYYLAPRCESLQQLDITSSNISVSYFNDFLNICGKQLTHLRLKDCKFVDNSALLQIAKKCKILKVLDLSYCEYDGMITDEGFSYLENLEFVENLNLRRTFNITAETLCKILKRNRRMRDLNLGGLNRLLDTVAVQLKNSCPDLEVIDLGGNNITSLGIDALAECKNLRKLNISWMNPNGYETYYECTIDKRSLRRLFSSCLLLEEVHLKYLNDDFLEELTLCKNLKQVHLDVCTKSNNSFAILEQCPKLHTIYAHEGKIIRYIYAKDGGSHFVAHSEKEYPHLPIYESDYRDYYYEYDDDDE